MVFKKTTGTIIGMGKTSMTRMDPSDEEKEGDASTSLNREGKNVPDQTKRWVA